MKGDTKAGSLHWQALQQEITPWKLEEDFKLEEVLLFLRFVIKSLWFQLGKQRCLANMLLPAFWQAKPFTTSRLLLLHSSICFYIQAFADSIALGTGSSHTCRGQSPYQMDHQAEQSVITFSKLLFSHTPYIISVKMREQFNYYVWKEKETENRRRVIGLVFFQPSRLKFIVKLHRRTQSTFLLIVLFQLPTFGTCLRAPWCCTGCWVSEVFGYIGPETRKACRRDIHKDQHLPRGNWSS